MMKLQDRVALVTGAGRGIGRAIAHRFAAEGARVVVADIDPTGGALVAEEITSAGHEGCFVALDVTDQNQTGEAVRLALDRFGTLDVLVNNAAITACYD